MTKECTVCHQEKDESEFSMWSFKSMTGYSNECKSCEKKKAEEYATSLCRWCGEKYKVIESFANSKKLYCSKKCEYDENQSRKK